MSEATFDKAKAKSGFGRWVPLALFILIALFLGKGLFMDPREIPSVLIGKPVPEFDLPPLEGRKLGLATSDLKGEVSLVNFFASWCTACRAEHPLLMRVASSGVVPVHGINYKDQPEDANRWLDSLGDPYTRIGADLDGRISIDWGVYGMPETFVIGKDGMIAYKHIGAITPKDMEETLLPLIRELQR